MIPRLLTLAFLLVFYFISAAGAALDGDAVDALNHFTR